MLKRIIYLFLGLILLLGCDLDNLHEQEERRLPIAAFTPSMQGNCPPPCMLTFNNESQHATRYVWDFGDGSPTVETSSPPYIYENTGSYTVQLTAYTDFGDENSTTRTVVVSTNVDCNVIAAFDIADSGEECKAPCSITFDNRSGNADTYLWDFGDGNTSTEKHPTHIYTKPGNYRVVLTAKGRCEETASDSINVGWITFERTFGTNHGEGHGIIQNEDDSYTIVGNLLTEGYSLMIKTDKFGNKLWESSISFLISLYVTSIANAANGSYLITGYLDPSESVGYYAEVDSTGLIWTELLSQAEGSNCLAIAKIDNSDSYIMTGYGSHPDSNRNEIFLRKINGQNVEWERFISSEFDEDFGNDCLHTSDDKYVVTGAKEVGIGHHENRLYIAVFSEDGNLERDTLIPGIHRETGKSIIEDKDGNYVIISELDTSNGSLIGFSKMNPIGEIIHRETIMLDGNYLPEAATLTDDGGYIITGNDRRLGIAFLIKTDANGIVEWKKTYNQCLWGYSVIQTSDSGYAFVGLSSFGISLIKTDSEGNVN